MDAEQEDQALLWLVRGLLVPADASYLRRRRLLSLFGMGYAMFVLFRALFFGIAVQGWSSLMVVLLLCSGVQLLMVGILREYLWGALDAARNRAAYLIRKVTELECIEASPALRAAVNRATATEGRP